MFSLVISHPQHLPETSCERLQCVFSQGQATTILLQPSKAEVQEQRGIITLSLIHIACGNRHILKDPHE